MCTLEGVSRAPPAGSGNVTKSTHDQEVRMAGKKARDIMSPNTECVGENETVLDAAKKLAQLDVGSMPICGEDERLKGMLTDRDIVVKVCPGQGPAGTRAARSPRATGRS
jgi:CBS domain-containing protein